MPKWNGKPNTKVEDHTWLELVYKPSLHMVVFDPSFGLCSTPMDTVYSRYGSMHISGRQQCGSDDPLVPAILSSSESLAQLDRRPWPRGQPHSSAVSEEKEL